MVLGRNNEVVGLTRFENKEMTGLSFGTKNKSRRINGVAVWRRYSFRAKHPRIGYLGSTPPGFGYYI